MYTNRFYPWAARSGFLALLCLSVALVITVSGPVGLGSDGQTNVVAGTDPPSSMKDSLPQKDNGQTDQHPKRSDQIVTLSVDDPRPVAAAVKRLEAAYRWVITYEDPPYSHESDVEDKTVRTDLGQKALFPKGGHLEISYTVSAKTGKPDNPAALIQRLLDAHAATGNPGVFRLEQTGQIFHVIPVQVKNNDALLADISPILDTAISFPIQERTLQATLDVICGAISQVTQTNVVVGTAPLNLLFNSRTRQGAANETARTVLLRTLQSTGRNLSWRLLYDPGVNMYALNMRVIFGPPPTPGRGIGTYDRGAIKTP